MIDRKIVLQKGVSLFSVLFGVALSAVLFLMIGQLVSVSKNNYIQAQNIILLDQNGREAIDFIRKNAKIAGFGVIQPVSAGNVQLDSSGRLPTKPPSGGYAAIRDWVYIGYYGENSPKFVNVVESGDSTPQSCASTMNSTLSAVQFFSLQSCGICYSPDPTAGAYDKSQLVDNPADNMATCCQASGTACSSASNFCATPNYNCGGISQGAVYQKLNSPLCVGTTCAGADTGASPSGDVLTVYYSNPGATNMTTLGGQTVTPNVTTPPGTLSSYTFQVDATTSTLQVIDSNVGTAPLNIVGNIEYMAVLVGESDLYTANTNGDLIPQINRYVAYGTSNLYPYRISAIRVGIVARSKNEVLLSPAASVNMTVLLGNDGNPIVYTTPVDRYMRRIYTTTIYLDSYRIPSYIPHCANVGGSYYLKTGGIPFSTTWTANDQCCGGPPCIPTDLNTCEANRMTGAC